jgi:hypothetical protein
LEFILRSALRRSQGSSDTEDGRITHSDYSTNPDTNDIMAGNISGPGILYVEARISRPDILDEETYTKWYHEDHIAEIVETSGINSARRFKNIDPNAHRPYLAMYPMKDLAFTQGEEFKKIRVKSDILPGSGICYDMADNDVRYDNLIQVYDPTKKGPGESTVAICGSLVYVQTKANIQEDIQNLSSRYRLR